MIAAINLDVMDGVRWLVKNWDSLAVFIIGAILMFMAYDLAKTYIATRHK